MFFEFSAHKISFLAYVALAISTALIVFTIANERAAIIPHSWEMLERGKGELLYWLEFKNPIESARVAEGAVPYGSGAPAKSIPVLLYHGEGSILPAMPTSVFVAHMKALAEAGWHTITLEQFKDFMEKGVPVPDHSFLLTFDDGRRDTYYTTDPILKDLGFTAVMFTITGFSMPDNGELPYNNFYLSKAELANMSRSGVWDIQSHGDQDHLEYSVPAASSTPGNVLMVQNAHFLSNKFWLPAQNREETTAEYTARITHDLSLSQHELEADFGKPVYAYAYPFNDYGEDTVNFPDSGQIIANVVQSLYTFTFYQTSPGNGDTFNYADPNQYFIKRIEPPSNWSGADLISTLEAGHAKSLPYTASDFNYGWSANWGIVNTSDTSLEVTAEPETTGGAAFLDGTEMWTNYRLTASVSNNFGTVSLIARHTNNSNPYLVCAFSDDRIYLERHSGENQSEIAVKNYTPPTNGSLSVSMVVSGDVATCSAYGVSVSGSAGGIAHGGVGVQTWDPTPGTAHFTLTAFSADPV